WSSDVCSSDMEEVRVQLRSDQEIREHSLTASSVAWPAHWATGQVRQVVYVPGRGAALGRGVVPVCGTAPVWVVVRGVITPSVSSGSSKMTSRGAERKQSEINGPSALENSNAHSTNIT